MSEQVRILVGEPDSSRFSRLRRVFEDEFDVTLHRAGSYAQLQLAAHRLKKNLPGALRLIWVASKLPNSPDNPNALLSRYFHELARDHSEVNLACLYAANRPARLPNDVATNPCTVGLVAAMARAEALRRVVVPVAQKLGLQPRPVAITLDDESELRAQVRLLSEEGSLEGGARLLGRLARCFFDDLAVAIYQLAQGLSGARVFRVRRSNSAGEYVLKLCAGRDLWKIKAEVERYPNIPRPHREYRKNVPDMILPRLPYKNLPQAATAGSWLAICYDYLGGGDFGQFLDLRTALTACPSKLQEKTRGTPLGGRCAPGKVPGFRRHCFETFLQWLCREWYSKAQRSADAIELWSTRDAPAREYHDFPPYELTGTTKAAILAFLHCEEAQGVGAHLLTDWDGCRNRVREFIDGTVPLSRVPKLKKRIRPALSPSHGDLNSNNAFLWCDHPDQPFLIDFPMFQLKGHALQDFARLEVEIKYALMDRQRSDTDKGPKALDLSSEQLGLWLELENHLLSERWRDPAAWSSKGYTENVELSLGLVQLIRERAQEVQQQATSKYPAPAFNDEHYPALLYHTLRAISFDSLSIFKRLLAVYSASRLLQALGSP